MVNYEPIIMFMKLHNLAENKIIALNNELNELSDKSNKTFDAAQHKVLLERKRKLFDKMMASAKVVLGDLEALPSNNYHKYLFISLIYGTLLSSLTDRKFDEFVSEPKLNKLYQEFRQKQSDAEAQSSLRRRFTPTGRI